MRVKEKVLHPPPVAGRKYAVPLEEPAFRQLQAELFEPPAVNRVEFFRGIQMEPFALS